MSDQPTRGTVAGRAYLDLQNLARRQGRPTDEFHHIYALEGFLARLAMSEYANRLVLKGGVLLAAYETRRPTRDVDLQGQRMSNDREAILAIVRAIAGIHVDDGLQFDTTDATAEPIREQDRYGGVRVTLTARLSAARLAFHVDVNVGDPIWPPPRQIELPRLLEGGITLAGYPLSMVHAEKLVTAVERGTANTRWRDFADVYTLAGRHDVNGDELAAAVARVAMHRGARLVPLSQVLEGYGASAQTRWVAWRRKHRLDDRLPERFDDVLARVIAFGEPPLAGASGGRVWRAVRSAWSS